MIVIPMAGLSSRFFRAGYTKPKYMLEAHNETLFDHAINGFRHYFLTEKFLFIVRDLYETPAFVKERVKKLGIRDYHITVLEQETRGQAETVTLGLESVEYEGAITIFNIDTFRPHFQHPELEKKGCGYLEVFKGEGENWSFAKPMHKNTTQVSQTAEKNPISDLCCTGLYYFSSKRDYLEAYNDYLSKPESEWEKAELYVAPLYNYLIKKGKSIHFNLIERNEVIFCGIPEEYTEFLEGKST